MLRGSSLTIRGQQFDDTLISGEAIEPDDADEADDADDEQAIENNVVEIVGSGTIQVTGGADDGEDEGNGDDDDDDEDGDNSFNTDIEPYTTILDDGDSITVTS